MKVGEDAAAFDSSKQSTVKWTFFTAELAVVLAILYAVSSPLANHILFSERLSLQRNGLSCPTKIKASLHVQINNA